MNLKKLNKSTLLIFAWLMLSVLNASAQTDYVVTSTNNKSIQDFTNSLVTKWEKNEIDLTKSFSVVLDGSITEGGKLDASKSKFTKSEGDEDIVNVAKSAIEAVGESGFLIYLSVIAIKDFTLSVSQNNDKVSGILTSNMKSEKEALNSSRAIKGILVLAKMQKEMTADDIEIINAFKDPFSESSQMILQFEMPKADWQELINRNLKKASDNRQKKSQM